MTNDKKPDDAAHRARNRTVMLTPDVTGEVRSRLNREAMQGGSALSVPGSPDDGFRSPYATAASFDAPVPLSSSTSALLTAATPVAIAAPKISPDADQPLIGFLVSFDDGPRGEYFELRVGRKVVTSDALAQGNNLLISHETVSPMHAILRVTASGNVQVLDQLSEHGTSITREGSSEVETLSGEKSTLNNGDTIQFGDRSFVVCIIARANE